MPLVRTSRVAALHRPWAKCWAHGCVLVATMWKTSVQPASDHVGFSEVERHCLSGLGVKYKWQQYEQVVTDKWLVYGQVVMDKWGS